MQITRFNARAGNNKGVRLKTTRAQAGFDLSPAVAPRPETLALPRGLETQAAAVLCGKPIAVRREDRRRGVVARRYVLYSV